MKAVGDYSLHELRPPISGKHIQSLIANGPDGKSPQGGKSHRIFNHKSCWMKSVRYEVLYVLQ